jgi:hypothetical protein
MRRADDAAEPAVVAIGSALGAPEQAARSAARRNAAFPRWKAAWVIEKRLLIYTLGFLALPGRPIASLA